ncbi:DNA primase/polymerase [Yersinia phage vB_YenS_P400]|nr:DNA primase/polymerase [Yersinia phage vB_YenS_P400]
MIGFKDYRSVGFPIIGIRQMDENRECMCERPECKSAGKHPIMSDWQHGYMWDDEQIENMEEMGQLKAFGILTNGYLVVDIDPRNGGDEGYEALCESVDMELADEAGFVVSTGGGGKHIYFKLPEGLKLKSHDKRFKGIDFKSSGFVIGCGSFHKSGNFYECDTGSPSEIGIIPQVLIDALRVDPASDFKFGGEEHTDKEICEMLEFIEGGDEYNFWTKIGMAVHDATGGNGFEAWDEWSQRFSGYSAGVAMHKWASYGSYDGEKVTVGTLSMYAAEGGWTQSVTFDATLEEIERLKEVENELSLGVGACPVEYSHIDVRYPPGFVGQLTSWINQNCADERKNISALAALHSASMMAGASCEIYLTPRKAIPNLFSIGLAGSGSGKGDVLSALQKIIECAGLNRTVAGKIRSERFIYDALCENQMLNLIMDEVGIKLSSVIGKKVADHNMSTAAAIMEAYTSETLYCDPRVTDEVRASFAKRLSLILQAIEENEDRTSDKQEVERQFKEVMSRIDGAIKNPFFSIFGVSTDDQFKKLITEENIKSGMMGRTIIMQELEAIAEENESVNYCDIPMHLQMKIKSIVNQGVAGDTNYTNSIVFMNEKKKIVSTEEVREKAIEFQKWLKLISREHVENGTGYEPLISRCAVKVAKIAGILACDTGVITMEHLSYAVALTIRSTSDLMMRANSLSGANSRGRDERKDGLEAMIQEHISRKKTKVAIIKDVSLEGNYKRDDVAKMIEILLSNDVISLDKDAPRTSNRAIIYKLNKGEAKL